MSQKNGKNCQFRSTLESYVQVKPKKSKNVDRSYVFLQKKNMKKSPPPL